MARSSFRYLWAGQTVSQIGDGCNKIALLWFVYQLTGSGLEMAVVGVLQSVPALFLSPFLGVFIDRLPAKGLMIFLDSVRVVLVALFPLLYLAGVLTLPVIYALVLVTAVAGSAFGPTLAASLPKLVKRQDLTAANGLIQNSATIGVLIGPAAGGLLATFIGAQNVLFVDAFTFLFSALCLTLVRFRQNPDEDEDGEGTSVVEELTEGLRFVFLHRPMIRRLMLCSALYAVGVGAFPIMLPILAKVTLHVGSTWLGYLWSGLGVGMVLATAALAFMRKRSHRANLFLAGGGIALAAASVFVLSRVTFPPVALVLVAIFGVGTAVFTPIVWTLIQNNTPDALRGRVFAMIATTDTATIAMAMGLMGFLADKLGPDTSLLAIGVALVAAAAYAGSMGLRYRPRPA